MRDLETRFGRTSKLLRAILAVLYVSAAAACAGGDTARERPASLGHQRLPIR